MFPTRIKVARALFVFALLTLVYSALSLVLSFVPPVDGELVVFWSVIGLGAIDILLFLYLFEKPKG